MGKFSQPRKYRHVSDETAVLPKAPVSAEPEAEIPETMAEFDSAAAPNEPTIPEPQDDLDVFDTQPNPGKAKNRKIMLVSIFAVAAALLIGAVAAVWFLFLQDPNDHLILNNVYVAGVNLGGMTKEEAQTALKNATDNTYSKNDMIVELPDVILSLTPADTKVALDVEAAVDAAYDYGRTGTREEKAAALESSLVTDHHIGLLPYLNLDLSYIRAQLDSYGASFNSTYLESSAVIEGEMPILDASDEAFDKEAPGQTLTLTVGNPGRYVDIDDVYNRVLDAYSFNIFLVQVSMKEEEKIPAPLDLNAIYAQCYSAPVSATIDEETYDVIPEIWGYGFDLEAAQALLDSAVYGSDPIQIPLEMIAPELLGETLSGMLFRDVLCEYQTQHTKDSNRNTNLTLACEAINGLILYPGDEFDFNTVVGKRTAEKGYKAAGAYSSGKTVQTIGGGVCQVSSTIYYCCLIADLEIINRLPHSYVSSYMPMGMDATVSWGGPEFTFKNSTNYPIRIETWVADGYVHCKLIGTDEKDYYIVMEYEVTGSVAPDTVYEEYPENNSEGYKDGEVIQTSYRGYWVNTYKCKYDKETDELIVREFDRQSTYKKRDKIIAKIVKETEAPTEAPATTPTVTEPAATNPPETQAPETTPPATDPPATNPPATDPPAADSGSSGDSGGSAESGTET